MSDRNCFMLFSVEIDGYHIDFSSDFMVHAIDKESSCVMEYAYWKWDAAKGSILLMTSENGRGSPFWLRFRMLKELATLRYKQYVARKLEHLCDQ